MSAGNHSDSFHTASKFCKRFRSLLRDLKIIVLADFWSRVDPTNTQTWLGSHRRLYQATTLEYLWRIVPHSTEGAIEFAASPAVKLLQSA